MPKLLHQLISYSAKSSPNQIALEHKNAQMSYAKLASQITRIATGLLAENQHHSKLKPEERVAVYLPKQFETVISMFAVSKAAGIFVPVNSLLKAKQVGYILENCQVSILVTSFSRYKVLKPLLAEISSLKRIILTDCKPEQCPVECARWEDLLNFETSQKSKVSCEIKRESNDIAAILYTSGSTGQPKGVVLSHENMIEGAISVSDYLNNKPSDRLLAVLPFSFDYGLSQLTTAFLIGARVVLLEYLLPRDVINAVKKYQITGLAAVPPLWLQLAELDWPSDVNQHLRYITNSGGAMPTATLEQLMQRLPNTNPYLMYGLTEAFRSTYLEPSQIETRPTSMGKAIPNATILVVNGSGELCKPKEKGELVHIGVHVSLGYWQNQQKTDEKFKPLPIGLQKEYGDKKAVWSGDIVSMDNDGFLYFVGRNDDMIKSSGYRISPAELEEAVYGHESVSEVAAIGLPHERLGHSILLVVYPADNSNFDEIKLRKYLKQNLPNYMQPHIVQLHDSLPRNPNGKINRNQLIAHYQHLAENIK